MFELHITCTKDIDKLKIDFSDGTSVVTEKQKKTEKPKEQKKPKEEPNDFDNFEAYTPKKEVVKPLELPEIVDRPVKIDNILNNFEI